MVESTCGSARADTGGSGVNVLKVNNFSTAEPLCYIKVQLSTEGEFIYFLFYLFFFFLNLSWGLLHSSSSCKLRGNRRNNSQRCSPQNVGSCCIYVGSGVQTDASALWEG